MTLDTTADALDDPDLYAMTETVDRMCRLYGTIMADTVRLLGRDPGGRFLAEDRRRYTDELRRWADPAVRRGAADGRYDQAVHDAYTLLNRRLDEWNDQLALEPHHRTLRTAFTGAPAPAAMPEQGPGGPTIIPWPMPSSSMRSRSSAFAARAPSPVSAAGGMAPARTPQP